MKYQHGLDPSAHVTPEQFYHLVGQTWESFMLTYNQQLSYAENDNDGDDIRNRDEETVFFTSPNDASSRPTNDDIRTAILANLVSATTLMNFQHLVNGGGDEDDDDGDTTGPPLTLQVFSGGGSGVLYGGFSASANFSGGVAPFTFSFSGLPQGVSYDEETHTFSGQPTQEGHTQGSVTVTDAEGESGTVPATYYVAPRAEPPDDDDDTQTAGEWVAVSVPYTCPIAPPNGGPQMTITISYEEWRETQGANLVATKFRNLTWTLAGRTPNYNLGPGSGTISFGATSVGPRNWGVDQNAPGQIDALPPNVLADPPPPQEPQRITFNMEATSLRINFVESVMGPNGFIGWWPVTPNPIVAPIVRSP